MKDEKGKVLQICYLTKEEMNDPTHVIREFTEDVSLEAVRKAIVAMRNICSTTENVPYGNPQAREDLFFVTDKMIRLFEACYVQQRMLRLEMNWDQTNTRQLKVLEKEVAKNIKDVPNKVPCISLWGRWLSLMGFKPGDEITVVSDHRKILITLTKDWDQKSQAVMLRA
jgi:hypothetical protein